MKTAVVGIAFAVVVTLAAAFGWGKNIVELVTECDFQAPYKCEVVRGAGIPIWPLGSVMGYIDMSEGENP